MNNLLPATTKALEILAKVMFIVLAAMIMGIAFYGSFYLGFYNGYSKGSLDTKEYIEQQLDRESKASIKEYETPGPQGSSKAQQADVSNWTGPELWEAVNTARQQNGVNALDKRDEICTIASIRLNELLDLGKLDAHEGFSNLPDRRDDLAWIYEKYTLTEFLVSGAKSADEAVQLWSNTLGHSKLVTGGEYVWGCIYAQNGIGVAITAY